MYMLPGASLKYYKNVQVKLYCTQNGKNLSLILSAMESYE